MTPRGGVNQAQRSLFGRYWTGLTGSKKEKEALQNLTTRLH